MPNRLIALMRYPTRMISILRERTIFLTRNCRDTLTRNMDHSIQVAQPSTVVTLFIVILMCTHQPTTERGMRLKSTRVSSCIAAKLCACFLLTVTSDLWSKRLLPHLDQQPVSDLRYCQNLRIGTKAQTPRTLGELFAWSAVMNLVIDRGQVWRCRSADMVDIPMYEW